MNFRQTGRSKDVHCRGTVKRIMKTACLFFLVLMLLFFCLQQRKGRTIVQNPGQIMITAHRGASYAAPENTRASVALAIAEGADYAEIDVRLTADKVPVLMHDRALFRTTGVVKEIDEVTYEEVTMYDVGGRYAERFVGETVPCLREILEEYGGKIKFNIELKGGENRELAELVVRVIEELGLEQQCVITSDAYTQLEWVKRANCKIRTGYILSLVYGEIFHCKSADFFSIKSEYITEQLVIGAHARGKEIHAWTVNREYEIKRMKKLGVDNIITDNPEYVREVLN